MNVAAVLRALLRPPATRRMAGDSLAPCDARLDVMPCPACGTYAAFDRPLACGARDCPWGARR
ncbi:MAG: hypothetical protein AB7N54_02390 [Alphaproteobacteria bacterium]